ncbi:MAG: DUF971 domain-containing protein [Candidatus Kapabacteria bacterium]|jgi:DUF971 family protein|nr:DUF971 domain-containing protein [Candidatus Kapabacteria bacterium]
MDIRPVAIKKSNEFMIYCKWTDGFESTVTLKHLREQCPCAHCEEDRKAKESKPIFNFKKFSEGMNDLVKLDKIGTYALAATWGDGHKAGIYTYENLRSIFEEFVMSEDEIKKIEDETAENK